MNTTFKQDGTFTKIASKLIEQTTDWRKLSQFYAKRSTRYPMCLDNSEVFTIVKDKQIITSLGFNSNVKAIVKCNVNNPKVSNFLIK